MVNINIPLPTSCASCPLSVRHFGKIYCPPLDGRVGNEGKDSRCPLVVACENTCDFERKSNDLISREDALNCFHDWIDQRGDVHTADEMPEYQQIEQLSSAEPKQRYTEEELSVFAHGISLSLLSKRSAQHWRYDEDTATEIKFLEWLYEKVVADMRGEQDDSV